MDEASEQLHLETRDAVVRALATRRPLLHHLNADTSWLLQIPRPANAVKHGSRVYYNILIDPWFVGGQADVAKWFSQQWHATPSAVQSIAEVEEMARQVEMLAGGMRRAGCDEESLIDAVAISHEFTDHCHKDTLLEVHRDVPVFATTEASKLISSWSHFRTVTTIPAFIDATDWHDLSLSPLPSWLSITRLTAPSDSLNLHSALLITFATSPLLSTPPRKPRSSLSINGDGLEEAFPSAPTDDLAEAVIYTPHGIPHTALSPIATADPALTVLAFLHGLHDVSISGAQQLNLGAKNGVLAQRVLKSRYWVATHDEVKHGGGLIRWFLKRRVWSIGEALGEARGEVRGEVSGASAKSAKSADGFEHVGFRELGNGESMVLE